MIGPEFRGGNPDLKAMQIDAGTGLGKRLKKDRKNSKPDFDPSHLIPLGLYRVGNHIDRKIVATSPTGESFELRVTPLLVNQGSGTMFVPMEKQEELLEKLFQRPKTDKGSMFRNR